MSTRTLLATLLVGAAAFQRAPARAASDYDFGMALMTEFGFDTEAEKFFKDLQGGGDRSKRLTGTFGLGGIKKLRAEQASRASRSAQATQLYNEAKKYIQEFLDDAPSDHPDRGAATGALLDIEKSTSASSWRGSRTP